MTGDELARGLRGCLQRSIVNRRAGDEDWPPTLGEFHALCRPMRHACHDTVKALPKPPLTAEQLREIDADIRRLREQLGMPTKEREPGEDG